MKAAEKRALTSLVVLIPKDVKLRLQKLAKKELVSTGNYVRRILILHTRKDTAI